MNKLFILLLVTSVAMGTTSVKKYSENSLKLKWESNNDSKSNVHLPISIPAGTRCQLTFEINQSEAISIAKKNHQQKKNF